MYEVKSLWGSVIYVLPQGSVLFFGFLVDRLKYRCNTKTKNNER